MAMQALPRLALQGTEPKRARPKGDQAKRAHSHAVGVTGGRRQPGRTEKQWHLVAWPGRAEQRVPGAACLQSPIRANGVTSLLRSSCCLHTDMHQALGGVRNRKKKAIIYQGWDCRVSAWDVLCRKRFAGSIATHVRHAEHVPQGPTQYTQSLRFLLTAFFLDHVQQCATNCLPRYVEMPNKYIKSSKSTG